MLDRINGIKIMSIIGLTLLLGIPAAAVAAPQDAKICLNCHKTAANNLRGHWESVAMKSSSIQLKIDSNSEVLKFDKNSLKVLNAPEQGDLEKMLRSIKKGHEVRIEYIEKDGGKVATLVSSKPPVKLSAEEKISLAEVEKLVALGPEKGKFSLYDSRPGMKFKEGTIPGAVSLPFPEFDKVAADRLPADKGRLVIFFCSGVTCNMSPGSQKKAKALGYTNIKVFVEGMPAWLGKNYGTITAVQLKDAYKDMPYVLLDARKKVDASKGFLKGAVAFPEASKAALKLLPEKKLKAPLFVYDENGKGNAIKVAKEIIKAGYGNVFVVSDGLDGAKSAGFPLETGKMAKTINYVPKPKPGEYPMADFQKLLDKVPGDIILVDVRNAEELKEGVIKGAINIPADHIDQNLDKLPREKKIITFCNTGTRAEMAYYTLKAKGYTNIAFLNANVDFDNGKPELSK
jgi:rhodanese-related sulfurtransferase